MSKVPFDQYKSPQWQKKRLEVMEAADYTCQSCGSKTNTLHVHHINYQTGKDLWDYDVGRFRCLCESCHDADHQAIEEFRSLLSKLPRHALGELSVAMAILDQLDETSREFLISSFWVEARKEFYRQHQYKEIANERIQ